MDEFLRYDTSVQLDLRTAAMDFELAGQQIEKGQNIAILMGAVNRDPRRFSEPDQLRLDRNEGRPLSFGTGIHACLGSSLARLELRHGVQHLLDRCGEYRVVYETLEWKGHAMLRGPRELRIIPSPAAS